MKKNCLDIGTIQAFLDGELVGGLLENAADHLAVCDDCAVSLATAEEESAIAFTALDAELNTLVPTQRLWAKINGEIERERKPFWQTVFAYFKNPTIASFASLLIVFGIFMAYLNSQAGENQTPIARTTETTAPISAKISKDSGEVAPVGNNQPTPVASTTKPKSDFRVVKAVVKEKEPIRTNKKPDDVKPQPTVYQYLPGEESYIKTIATLENTINTRKDEILKPSERFTFEQNLAVVNDSITKMRQEVKKSPRNESAKQILMASYQNKVDLLNSVSERNELMALR